MTDSILVTTSEDGSRWVQEEDYESLFAVATRIEERAEAAEKELSALKSSLSTPTDQQPKASVEAPTGPVDPITNLGKKHLAQDGYRVDPPADPQDCSAWTMTPPGDGNRVYLAIGEDEAWSMANRHRTKRSFDPSHVFQQPKAEGEYSREEDLKSAFVSGCCVVLEWTNSGMPQDDLDEAGYDYARKILNTAPQTSKAET